ncbi:MAG: methyltransferase domain-containing protein [Elusimicrobia bacterium]|nr:methyltransferase domain-containing protein [Elusimicrobiota bacterium]
MRIFNAANLLSPRAGCRYVILAFGRCGRGIAAEHRRKAPNQMKEAEIRPRELFDRYLLLSSQDAQALLSARAGFIDVPCPACASPDAIPAFKKQGFNYVLCRACASLYVSPRPTPEQLLSFYRDGEAVKFWSSEFFRQTAEARREKMFRPRAQLISKLAGRASSGAPQTLVDIGAGYGLFLEEMKKLDVFHTLVGLEPGPDMADICRARGFRIIQKVAENAAVDDCSADFATAFEVLEHVFDPLLFLSGARRLLRPGGQLIFTTLAASGFDIQVLWDRSKSVYPPHHLNLLSAVGIEMLVARAGFSLLELSTPGELDVDIVANMADQDKNLPLPRFVSQILACDEDGRRQFQSFLTHNRLSSHIRVVAGA